MIGSHFPSVVRIVRRTLLLAILLTLARLAHAQSAPASEQTPSGNAVRTPPVDPNPGALSLSGGFDFASCYMFRGIRQHSTGLATWPWADLGIAAYAGESGLKSVSVNVGTWNSQHTGDTGMKGPSTKLWYESDFYATVGVGLSGGVSLATTYTAYTSPNNTFSTVKELMVKLAIDDTPHLGRAAIKPYAIVARELDTAAGLGQADSGDQAGTYFEAGIAPGFTGSRASLTVPLKAGFSLGNYYELAGTDHRFGFLSIAGVVTVPLGSTTRFGGWNVHGGVEFQKLGDATAAFNGGDRSKLIGSIGVGFAY